MTPEEAGSDSQAAYFFDFDGTLSHIVDTPDEARVEPAISDALRRLILTTGGAVAVISGRSVSQLDAFLAPLAPAVSGVHGMERRRADGSMVEAVYDEAAHRALSRQAEAFAGTHPGVLAETKPGSVAIHYRRAPGLEGECLAFAEALRRQFPDLSLMRGKKVAELRFGRLTKGDALRAFMAEAPFAGRLPVFFGDDVTDEAAFAAAAALGGIGVKIGPGASAARFRFRDIPAFHRWLTHFASGTPGTPPIEQALARAATDELLSTGTAGAHGSSEKQQEQQGA